VLATEAVRVRLTGKNISMLGQKGGNASTKIVMERMSLTRKMRPGGGEEVTPSINEEGFRIGSNNPRRENTKKSSLGTGKKVTYEI